MIRLLDNSSGSAQRMMEDKIRQVSVLQRSGTHEQGLFLGSNSHRHPAVVFYCHSRHCFDSPVYLFK